MGAYKNIDNALNKFFPDWTDRAMNIGIIIGSSALIFIGGYTLGFLQGGKSKEHKTPTAIIETQSIEDKTKSEHTKIKPKKETHTDIAFIIDPGHGGAKGENVGTTLKGYNLPERDYVLDVGTALEKKLEDLGYSLTETTRTGIDTNLKLADRRKQFDVNKKNVGVSLHVDGHTKSEIRGSKIFYNPKAQKLAEYLAKELRNIFTNARAIPTPGYYNVLKGNNPAVLVELGFGGSNTDDARIAVEKKTEIVNALARALQKYHTSISSK